jgi:hypothetical protein
MLIYLTFCTQECGTRSGYDVSMNQHTALNVCYCSALANNRRIAHLHTALWGCVYTNLVEQSLWRIPGRMLSTFRFLHKPRQGQVRASRPARSSVG